MGEETSIERSRNSIYRNWPHRL